MPRARIRRLCVTYLDKYVWLFPDFVSTVFVMTTDDWGRTHNTILYTGLHANTVQKRKPNRPNAEPRPRVEGTLLVWYQRSRTVEEAHLLS